MGGMREHTDHSESFLVDTGSSEKKRDENELFR